MRKDVEKQPTTREQRSYLAHQTCQWWNAVFVQANRFFDALDKNRGDMSWEGSDENHMLIPERTFLITAIYHAIEDLQKLDIEMQRREDFSLHPILDEITAVIPLQDIKNLRDMNEHGLDYLVGMGQKQSQYQMKTTQNGYKFAATPSWTIVHGDAKVILFGNVRMDQLLIAMKKLLPIIQAKTKEIFEHELLCYRGMD